MDIASLLSLSGSMSAAAGYVSTRSCLALCHFCDCPQLFPLPATLFPTPPLQRRASAAASVPALPARLVVLTCPECSRPCEADVSIAPAEGATHENPGDLPATAAASAPAAAVAASRSAASTSLPSANSPASTGARAPVTPATGGPAGGPVDWLSSLLGLPTAATGAADADAADANPASAFAMPNAGAGGAAVGDAGAARAMMMALLQASLLRGVAHGPDDDDDDDDENNNNNNGYDDDEEQEEEQEEHEYDLAAGDRPSRARRNGNGNGSGSAARSETAELAARAASGGAAPRGAGSLLAMARAQAGLSLEQIMERLSQQEDRRPAHKGFVADLLASARAVRESDCYELLLAVEGLGRLLKLEPAAFGESPYPATATAPDNANTDDNSTGNATAGSASSSFNGTAKTVAGTVRAGAGDVVVAECALAVPRVATMAGLGPRPALALPSAAALNAHALQLLQQQHYHAPTSPSSHHTCVLAMRGGVSFAAKAIATSSLTVTPLCSDSTSSSASGSNAPRPGVPSVLLVCQDSALWPYTMTDSTGDWAKHRSVVASTNSSNSSNSTMSHRANHGEVLCVMLQRDDGLALARHVRDLSLAAAAAPTAASAAANGASDPITAAFATLTAGSAVNAAVAPAPAVVVTPVRVAVLRRPRASMCAVCQDEFALNQQPNDIKGAENNAATAPTGDADDADQSQFVSLPCGHRFHPSCIAPWLQRQHTCPLCRHELPRRERKARAPTVNADLQSYRSNMFC